MFSVKMKTENNQTKHPLNFSSGREGFDDINSLRDRCLMKVKSWWLIHGVHAPTLQKIACKLLDNLVHHHAMKETGILILSCIQ